MLYSYIFKTETRVNTLYNVLKCPEKYIKAYVFFIIQWIEFKFENVKYISIYLTNIQKKK